MKLVKRSNKPLSARIYKPKALNSQHLLLHTLFQKVYSHTKHPLIFYICKQLRTTNFNRHCVKLSELLLNNEESAVEKALNNLLRSENVLKKDEKVYKEAMILKSNLTNSNNNFNQKEISNTFNSNNNKEYIHNNPATTGLAYNIAAPLHTNIKSRLPLFQNVFEHTITKSNATNIKPVTNSNLFEEFNFESKSFNNMNYLNKTFVNPIICVSKIVDCDETVCLPKMTVYCLKISEKAKKKILMFGGSVNLLEDIFKITDLSKACVIKPNYNNKKRMLYKGAPGSENKKGLEKIVSKRKDVLKRPS